MPEAKGIARTSKIEVGQIKSEDPNPELVSALLNYY